MSGLTAFANSRLPPPFSTLGNCSRSTVQIRNCRPGPQHPPSGEKRRTALLARTTGPARAGKSRDQLPVRDAPQRQVPEKGKSQAGTSNAHRALPPIHAAAGGRPPATRETTRLHPARRAAVRDSVWIPPPAKHSPTGNERPVSRTPGLHQVSEPAPCHRRTCQSAPVQSAKKSKSCLS